MWRASNAGLNFPGTTTLQNVQSLAIDPSAPATLYAGTSSGGVYKTENSGATWSASNTGLPNPVINRPGHRYGHQRDWVTINGRVANSVRILISN